MILTLISPAGERWSIKPAPDTGAEWAVWLLSLHVDKGAAKPLVMLRQSPTPPKGKSILARTKTGWQAILSNP